MKVRHITTYRIGRPKYVHRINEDGERVRVRITPVNKVVRVEDGKEQYTKMEKQVADSIEEFRAMGRREIVEGEATEDVIRAKIARLSDEELEALGLSRRVEIEEAEDEDVLSEAIESIEDAIEETAEVREFAEEELAEAEEVADFGADFFDEEE